MFSLHIPESERVVLRHREEEIGILGVELELIDSIAVTNKVSDAVHAGGTEHSDDATTPPSSQDWSGRENIVS